MERIICGAEGRDSRTSSEAARSPLQADLEHFCQAAEAIGYTLGTATRVASQSIGRTLTQTGRHLDDLTLADFGTADACVKRDSRRVIGVITSRP